MRKESLHKSHLDLLAFIGAGPGWKVNTYDTQRTEVRAQITPFRIDIVNAQTDCNLVGRATRIYPNPAVTLLLRVVKMTGQTTRAAHCRRKVALLCFELLDTNDIGPLSRKPPKPAFCGSGANAVEIARDYA